MLPYFTFGLLVVAISLWLRWRSKNFRIFKDLGIPGPEPSILFGNALEMMKKDPMTSQKEWTDKYGSVVGYFYGTWPVLLISDPDLMKQVLIKDFSSFADRPSNMLVFDGDSPTQDENQNMLNLRGKRWKEVRNMLTPAFTSGKLKQMVPLLDDCASIMLSKLEAAAANSNREVNIYPLFQGMAMDAIGRSAFGVEASVQKNPKHPLLHYSVLLLDAKFKTLLTLLLVSFRQLHFLFAMARKVLYMIYGGGKDPLTELFRISADVVKLRKENPAARRLDLLQTITDARSTGEEVSEHSLTATAETPDTMSASDNVTENVPSSKNLQSLTDTEITANAMLFFLAGYETTSVSMAFLTYHLMNNPDIQEKVREEIFEVAGKTGPISYEHISNLQYTDRAIMESLRMHPAVYNFENRVSNREVMLGKWKIPANMTIQIPVWSLHYNPDNFEDPYTFNPDRFLPENRGKDHSVTWQPFGIGPRNCIGMRFALMEIKLTMIKLLRKYRFEQTEKSAKEKMDLSTNLVIFHPKTGIHLRAVPI